MPDAKFLLFFLISNFKPTEDGDTTTQRTGENSDEGIKQIVI